MNMYSEKWKVGIWINRRGIKYGKYSNFEGSKSPNYVYAVINSRLSNWEQ